MATSNRTSASPINPRRILRLWLVAAAMASVVAFVSPPAAASHTSCSVRWGSLAKSSSATGAGQPVAVRTGRHTCFDRFVIDLNGPASAYNVEYVSKLVQDGSGKPVAVTGGAIIRVIVHANAFDDAGQPTINPAAVDAHNVAGYRTFRDVAWAGSFEGQTTFGIGVRARLPFRVFTLGGPGNGSRLVIDVAHRW